MNQIKESYGTEIIILNDKFQLRLIEGYYYKPELFKEPKNLINGLLFRDYREYDCWEIIWSNNDKMDVGVLHNNRNSIIKSIEQHLEITKLQLKRSSMDSK